MENIKIKDHLGNNFDSLSAMAKAYGLKKETLSYRLRHGMDIETVLTKERIKGKSIKDHLGNEFNSISAMCKKYNINAPTFQNRIKKGMSLEEALTAQVCPKCLMITDPFGKCFNSLEELLNYYKVDRTTYGNRIKQGWPQLEALTFPPNFESPFPEAAGVNFKNVEELCKYLERSRAAIQSMFKKGYSLDSIIKNKIEIDKKIRKTFHNKAIIYGAYYNGNVVYVGQTTFELSLRVKQHKNDCQRKGHYKFHKFLKKHLNEVEFKVIEEFHNISQKELDEAEKKWIAFYNTFENGYNSTIGGEGRTKPKMHFDIELQNKIISSIKNGMTIKDIAKTVNCTPETISAFLKENNIEHRGMKKKITDHLGNVYDSFTEMAKVYSIHETSIRIRIKKGMSLEQALTTETTKPIKINDHFGNEFSSIEELCRFYNINSKTFTWRLKKGWPIEKALTVKDKRPKKSVDHLGNLYISKSAMCKKYGISTAVFNYRIEKGYSLKDALTLPMNAQYCSKKTTC